jgi:hypothetical protein
MSVEAYLNPDFTWPKKLLFLLFAFIGLTICLALVYCWSSVIAASSRDEEAPRRKNDVFHNYVELLYEMFISATSVLSFACSYVIINHVYQLAHTAGYSYEYFKGFIDLMDNYKDFVLLVLICLSCLLNTILDKLIIPLKRITKEQKATVRMMAMFYAIIVLLFLNNIGDESEYSPVMMYYLGLMVGRFVYFDASFKDFLGAIKNVFLKLPLLVLAMTCAGVLCYIGFSLGYLLERNYYIVGILYTHLFILIAIFIVKISHVLELVFKTEKRAPKKRPRSPEENRRPREPRGSEEARD